MAKMTETPSLNWPRIIIQSSLLAFALLIVPLLLMTAIAAIKVIPFVNVFLSHAQLDRNTLISRVKSGWNQEPPVINGNYVLLALGTDELPNRPDMPIMTDTIIMASIDLKQSKLTTVTIPRDYWSDQFQTKINSLYEYGRQQDSTQPYALLLQELAILTPVKVTAVLTISPTTLMQLIDVLGGVEITVPVGFTDTQFPRDDVDIITERDPKKLYETVMFNAGLQTMNGRQAMQYMRSRHGRNGQNDDIARAERQSLVMQSVAAKFGSLQLYTDPKKLADLWLFYQAHFNEDLPLETIISLVRYRIDQIGWQGTISATLAALREFTVAQTSIPITRYNQVTRKIEPGILYNPPIKKNKYSGQWVYIATDSATLTSYITQRLNHD